jgi:hypothetical protein
MIRRLILAIGLVFSFVGVILTLLVLLATGSYLGGDWPPVGYWVIPQSMSFSDFTGLLTFPTEAFVGFGFLLLAFGIPYPKQSTGPTPKDETTSEGEEKKG